tara:strand:+ start:216 stop:584 length:369 start_codon:yes stop_codon:yes gene_type:complete
LDLGWYWHGANYFVWPYPETSFITYWYRGFATLGYIPYTERYRMNSMIAKTLDLCQRLVSLFIASALPIITGGAILGVDIVKSAGVAGLTALFGVIQKLAAASVDGELSAEEIQAAFGSVKK